MEPESPRIWTSERKGRKGNKLGGPGREAAQDSLRRQALRQGIFKIREAESAVEATVYVCRMSLPHQLQQDPAAVQGQRLLGRLPLEEAERLVGELQALQQLVQRQPVRVPRFHS